MVLVRRHRSAPSSVEPSQVSSLNPVAQMSDSRPGCPIILLGASPLYRKSLETVIGAQIRTKSTEAFYLFGGCATVEDFETSLSGLSEAQQRAVIVLLLDEGRDLAAEIEKINAVTGVVPSTKVIFISSNRSTGYASRCIESGVHAYIFSDVSEEILIDCISVVASGHLVFPSHLQEHGPRLVLQQHERVSTVPGIFSGIRISETEAQILTCLSSGMSNKEIARVMGFTDPTTKLAVRKLLGKIGAKNRVQAAVWAKQNGYSSASSRGSQ